MDYKEELERIYLHGVKDEEHTELNMLAFDMKVVLGKVKYSITYSDMSKLDLDRHLIPDSEEKRAFEDSFLIIIIYYEGKIMHYFSY